MGGSRVPPELRTYQLCRLLSCTPTELDEQPARLLDWFVEFRRIELEVEAEQQQER